MNAIDVRTQQQNILDTVRGEEFRSQLAQALPEGVTVDRFTRVTATALMQAPDLVKADRASLYAAVIRAAQDGLHPDGKEAALVVFGDKVAYMPMVGGFRKIAAEYGWTIRSAVVYAGDEFSHDPTNATVHHRWTLGANRGDMIGAYALAVHRDGRRELEVMDAGQVEKVRQVSRSKDRGPWKDWPERMWEKSPVRRLFQKLPLDPADKRIASVLDASQVEPREAERLLYGRSRPTLPPVSSAPALNESTPSPAESQQAGGEAVEATAATFPAPGDDEPEPTFDDGSDAEAFTAAAMTAVPADVSSQNAGRTLAEIADKGPDGAKFLWWALRQEKVTGDFRTALEVFVREAGVVHPVEGELWQRYSRWLNERQAA